MIDWLIDIMPERLRQRVYEREAIRRWLASWGRQ
jgi:hypothetical protein